MIFAAAAVMVAVFFTFALSGPLPPKEMGVTRVRAFQIDGGPREQHFDMRERRTA